MRRHAAFVLTGGVGFLVDAGILALLTAGLGLNPFLSRIVSIALAMATTWIMNRTITFGPSDRPVHREAARYGGVAVATAGLNYLVYSALLLAAPGLWPLAAVAVSSIAAMAASWLGYSRLVFTRH